MQKNLTIEQRLGRRLARMSAECARGVIAISVEDRAGLAQIGPNCLLWSWMPTEDCAPVNIFDLYLN